MANLLDTATQSGNFQQFLQAVEVVGLEKTLQSPGPFTLFAPTDEAFADLPSGTLETWLDNPQKLQKIISYHFVSGDVRSDDIAQIDEAPTLEGSVLAIDNSEAVKVNEARILQTDILADNGVIHIIDRVLMPAMVAGHTGES